MAGPEQSFGAIEGPFLRTVSEGFVSQVLEELFDAVGVEIRHGQPFTASGMKYRQKGRKVTKAIAPVTRNRGHTEGFALRLDALGNQLFEGALTRSGNFAKALIVKRPEVGVSNASCVFGKGNDGVRLGHSLASFLPPNLIPI